jgi:lipoate-protein ligase A
MKAADFMLCIQSHHTDTAFNLAAEQYLLERRREDVFMLWRSTPAVVIGRNQNAWAQVNVEYLYKQRLPIYRRISGGGAVYHDLGNLNFAFIQAVADNRRMDFESQLRPIIAFLNQIRVSAKLDGRSDIIVNGLKVSGNAQHIHKHTMLHHGTLLFTSNLAALRKALQTDSCAYYDRAVQSNRRPVTNICDYLPQPETIDHFSARLLAFMQNRYCARRVDFSAADQNAIDHIANQKYRSREWNIGHISTYQFKRSCDLSAGQVDIELVVANGIIRQAKIINKACNIDYSLATALIGCRHDPADIQAVLRRWLKGNRSAMDEMVDRLMGCCF